MHALKEQPCAVLALALQDPECQLSGESGWDWSVRLSVTMYVRVGMSVGWGGRGQEKPVLYIVWFLIFSFTIGRFFSCLLWLIYTLHCQIISLKSNQCPRNWFIAEVGFSVCRLVPNIYISKLYVIHGTIQRSESRQRSDLVIFESGELYHLNPPLEGLLSYTSYIFLRIEEGFRYPGAQLPLLFSNLIYFCINLYFAFHSPQ